MDEPPEFKQDLVEPYPVGRCGFTTCVNDETLKPARDMNEIQSEKLRKDNLFRERLLAAESLEECLKIIEAEGANLTVEEPQKWTKTHEAGVQDFPPEKSRKPLDQSYELHETISEDDFTLWGNRIRK
jgi:hypothetical protein